jgi:hypothetical protein
MNRFLRTGFTKLVWVILTVGACSGCATQFLGSAPSPLSGRAYVVGQHDGQATVWLCPIDRAHGECMPVDVEEL